MKSSQIAEFLGALGTSYSSNQRRGGWFLSYCPLGPWNHKGGKSSAEVFGISQEPGDGRCNCFSCGWSGTMTELVMELRHRNSKQHAISADFGKALELIDKAVSEQDLDLDTPDIEQVLFGKKEPPHEFPDWWLESFPPVSDFDWARSYLSERRVAESLWHSLDLRADTTQRRICFPVKDFKGHVLGLHGRAVDPTAALRYRMYNQAGKNNPIVWLGESWVDLSKPIVVVEGPFDLTTVLPVYSNTVCPLFVNPSVAKLKRMADCLEWVTFYDRGVGGDAGRAKVQNVLGADHIIQHVLPPEGRKDPGECSIQEIRELLQPYLQLNAKIL